MIDRKCRRDGVIRCHAEERIAVTGPHRHTVNPAHPERDTPVFPVIVNVCEPPYVISTAPVGLILPLAPALAVSV